MLNIYIVSIKMGIGVRTYEKITQIHLVLLVYKLNELQIPKGCS